jgi:hypothetical protein
MGMDKDKENEKEKDGDEGEQGIPPFTSASDRALAEAYWALLGEGGKNTI